jgi:hypothetical protein
LARLLLAPATLAGMAEAQDVPPAAVFISYCHVDKVIAVALQEELERRGHEVFRDETGIEAGEPLPPVLAEAIDKAELFLAVVSKDYVQSNPCNWELSQAIARKFGDDRLRVVPLKVGDVSMPPMLSDVLFVPIDPQDTSAVVNQVLRKRREIEQRDQAARPVPADLASNPDAPRAGDISQRELVREAVRYARELETLAQIDEALVDVQVAIEGAARSYDEDAYKMAYNLWQRAWVRLTSPVADVELLDRLQVIGSLLSEVVLSDRTPRQVRPWLVQRSVTSARAAIGHAMRGEALPAPAFPGTEELRELLGKGDSEKDPIAPLRQRVADLGTPVFHS